MPRIIGHNFRYHETKRETCGFSARAGNQSLKSAAIFVVLCLTENVYKKPARKCNKCKTNIEPLGRWGIIIILDRQSYIIRSYLSKYHDLLCSSVAGLSFPQPSQSIDKSSRHTGPVFFWYHFLSDHQAWLSILIRQPNLCLKNRELALK